MEKEQLEKQIELLEKEIQKGRERLSTDRMDISFGELINLYKNKELIIRPEYQRLFRWTYNQKTAFIESLLLSIPIPPIFVAEDDKGIWELVDGLQRITTIISFFGELEEDLSSLSDNKINLSETDEDENDIEQVNIGNRWALNAGNLIENLEGLTIDTLPLNYKINLKRAICRVEILRGESNIAMKYELFKRLNSGGSKLTPQEIRNAIYRGINPVINDLLMELSQNKIFQKLTNLSEQKKKELYDQELILRFVAFLNNVEEVNQNTENYLNSFMEKSVVDDKFNASYFRDTFNEVMQIIDNIGDLCVFRNSRNLFVPAEYEGITIGLAQNIKLYSGNIELVKTKVKKLKEDSMFKKLSGSASNSKSRTKNRLKRVNTIFSTIS